MEQPPRSPDCNPIEHLWDELGRAISSMDNPPQNLDELRQVLLDKWAQVPVQRLQCLVASMPRRLAAIIAARGGNTRYWPGTHKTRPPGSVTKKIIFVRPNLPQLSSSDIQVCSFDQLLILSSNVVKTDKTQQNKEIGHQIHRKHHITPNNLSLDLADWWNRNNHKKDTSSRGVTTFFAKSVYSNFGYNVNKLRKHDVRKRVKQRKYITFSELNHWGRVTHVLQSTNHHWSR